VEEDGGTVMAEGAGEDLGVSAGGPVTGTTRPEGGIGGAWTDPAVHSTSPI
jgi:hypothetical protein